MTQLVFGNQDQTILASAIDDSQLTFMVAAGTGAEFPNISEDQSLKLTIVSTTNQLINEIVLATAKDGDVFTVVRAQEGTIARSWPLGSFVINLMTAGTSESFVQGYELENAYYSSSFINMATETGAVTTDPVNPTDLVNKRYADSMSSNQYKPECKAATTTNVLLLGLQTIDGYALAANDRVLVNNQTNAPDNGIYIASEAEWARSSDMSTWIQVPGAYTFVQNGTLYAGTSWVVIADVVGVIDVTDIDWTQVSGQGAYTAGTGLTLLGTQFRITDTTVTPGDFGSAAEALIATPNAQGQLTALSSVPISIAASQLNTLVQNEQLQNDNVIIGSDSLSLGSTLSSLNNVIIDGSLNTLSNIPNASLVNSEITINGNLVNLGGSTTVSAITDNPLTIGAGLNGTSFDGSAPVTISIANVGTANTFGSSNTVPVLTTNAQGQVSSVVNTNIDAISLTSGSISSAPGNDNDLVNKLYVDTAIQGLNGKDSASIGTTENIILSGEQTIDGVLTSLSRVLVKNQTDATENGIYISDADFWSRSSDANTWEELVAAFCFVEEGTTQDKTGWICTIAPVGVLGVDPVTFTQFSGAGTYTAGTGLTLSGSQFSITNTSVAAGSYGSSSDTVSLTANAQGQLTALSSAPISIAASQINTSIPNAGLTNSAVTINGSTVSLGSSTTISAATTAAATFDSSGLGAASGTTFDGSIARTVSYNTLGASPLAGSASIATVGTVTSGTWNGTIVDTSHGGTGNSTGTASAVAASSITGTTLAANVVSSSLTSFGVSPSLITPDLGTPSAAVLTNATGTASGLTAGNVNTNANLTGPITSVGNATSIASKTGTGNVFVMNTFPTLVSPLLGTPVSGVMTNVTGTAAGLTAGNVTTNANLTGPITSIGNTTSIASQTGTGSTFVVQNSPSLITPELGTPSSGVLTNCTGYSTSNLSGIVAPANGGTGTANLYGITLGGEMSTASTFTSSGAVNFGGNVALVDSFDAAGAISLAGEFATTGASSLTLNTTGITNSTLPVGTKTLVPNDVTITGAGLVTGGGDLSDNRTLTVTAASNADAITGTATNVAMTPNAVRYSKTAIKAWASFETVGTSSIYDSYNITSLTDGGVGITNLNFTVGFANVSYTVSGLAEANGGANLLGVITRWGGDTKSLSSCRVRCSNQSGGMFDSVYQTVLFTGTLSS